MHTLAPHGFLSVKATIKVSSTETGVIFGNILWEGAGMTEACVVLNDIHIDIMDYIKPSYCNEAQVSLTFKLPSYACPLSCLYVVPEHVDRIRVGEQSQCGYQHNVSEYRRFFTSYASLTQCYDTSRHQTILHTNSDLRQYLKHIMASTNMACLTPEGAMSGDCDFLSANLYARSLFGECNLLLVHTVNLTDMLCRRRRSCELEH